MSVATKLLIVAACLDATRVQCLPQSWSTNVSCNSSMFQCVYCHDPDNACCDCWISCEDECDTTKGLTQECCDCWHKFEKLEGGCKPDSWVATEKLIQPPAVTTQLCFEDGKCPQGSNGYMNFSSLCCSGSVHVDVSCLQETDGVAARCGDTMETAAPEDAKASPENATASGSNCSVGPANTRWTSELGANVIIAVGPCLGCWCEFDSKQFNSAVCEAGNGGPQFYPPAGVDVCFGPPSACMGMGVFSGDCNTLSFTKGDPVSGVHDPLPIVGKLWRRQK